VWILTLCVLCFQALAADDTHPTFSQAELDQLLAPIALYPDSLLSQVLMAFTYPAEVTQAAAWSKQNPQQKGDDAVKAVPNAEVGTNRTIGERFEHAPKHTA
jgi:hypothetical protein